MTSEVLDERKVLAAFANQTAYCRANDAPVTGRVVEAIAQALMQVPARDSDFGRRVLGWTGAPIADALALRCAGGFHALFLSGKAPALGPLYAGDARAMADAPRLIAATLAAHEADLLPWLDGPPQTNEAGRSSNYIAAMLWLAARGLPSHYECLEIGSSAGLNLMIDRYRYDLGGVKVGPTKAAIAFRPEWRGPPPPKAKFTFASLRGCDIAPVDLSDPKQALRLTAYIWPEHTARFARMKAAIDMVKAQKPDLAQGDADVWIEQALAAPQAPGTTRIVMHSIVWQYLGAERQARITAAIEAAAARATPDRALTWIALEADRTTHRHDLVVRYWPGDGATHALGTAHAHGAWVGWSGV